MDGVYRRCIEHNIPRQFKASYSDNRPSASDLRDMYTGWGCIDDIAAELDVSVTIVGIWLRDVGVVVETTKYEVPSRSSLITLLNNLGTQLDVAIHFGISQPNVSLLCSKYGLKKIKGKYR